MADDTNYLMQGSPQYANALVPGAGNLQPVGPMTQPFAQYDAPLNEAVIPGGFDPQPKNYTTNSYEDMVDRRAFLQMKKMMGMTTSDEDQEHEALHNQISLLQQLHAAQEAARQSDVPNDVMAMMQGMRGASGGQ